MIHSFIIHAFETSNWIIYLLMFCLEMVTKKLQRLLHARNKNLGQSYVFRVCGVASFRQELSLLNMSHLYYACLFHNFHRFGSFGTTRLFVKTVRLNKRLLLAAYHFRFIKIIPSWRLSVIVIFIKLSLLTLSYDVGTPINNLIVHIKNSELKA